MPIVVRRPPHGALCQPVDPALFCNDISTELDDFCDICEDAFEIVSSVVLKLHKAGYQVEKGEGDKRMFRLRCGVTIFCSIREERRVVIVDGFARV